MAQAAPRELSDATGGIPSALWLFSLLWAASAVFHVMGNPLYAWGPLQVIVGVAAAAVVIWPGRILPMCGLAVAICLSTWSEAPLLGNQWLLSAMVGVLLLLCSAAALRAPSGRRARRLSAIFLPAARLTTLAFYGFAAFNKLNSGFVRPATSCAGFYLSESASSLGLGSLGLGSGWTGRAAIYATMACELGVFTLLLLRRTRPFGVLLGLCFHFVLALDRTHQFVDFSSILVALFTLFLPATFASWARRLLATAGRPLVRGGQAVGAVAAVGLCSLAARSNSHPDLVHTLRVVAVDLWLPYGLAAIALIAAWLLRTRRAGATSREPVRLRPAATWALVVPVVAVLNGFSPYLGLKTANGWNMYANLRTSGGASNHYVITRTATLSGRDADPLVIVSSDDPNLTWYGEMGYALPRRSLRAYLSSHQSDALTYRDGSTTHRLAHASDDPDLVRHVPVVVAKLLVLRAVDLSPSPRCQDVWGPAL